jgi:hypothetical protein
MTKFLVHGIPTFYTPDEVRKDIEIANPSVKLTKHLDGSQVMKNDKENKPQQW